MKPHFSEDDWRWRVEGRPVEIGSAMELRWPDGTWEIVRIETGKTGLEIIAHCNHHGHEFVVDVDWNEYALRWPTQSVPVPAIG